MLILYIEKPSPWELKWLYMQIPKNINILTSFFFIDSIYIYIYNTVHAAWIRAKKHRLWIVRYTSSEWMLHSINYTLKLQIQVASWFNVSELGTIIVVFLGLARKDVYIEAILWISNSTGFSGWFPLGRQWHI